ncbi:MAG: PAS domain-containing sensor histidine kinase [Prolixibacteraceae bacterium]|nr:PAS domain-containing sensor histidine kinase [Prolixibacteraceae bacterium]
MKLLSRFIWLIIGILMLVFITITIYQFRTENEFNDIKKSIKKEYDVQVDKMLAIDPHSVGDFSSYMAELANTSATKTFLSLPEPNISILQDYLFNDILTYHNIDAIWFYKQDGSLFHFKTVNDINQNQMPVPEDKLNEVISNDEMFSFYANYNNTINYYHSKKIKDVNGQSAYIIMASKMDERWTDKYMATINNSVINIVPSGQELEEIDNKTIRITRELNAYDGSTAAILNIELHLPFLALWEKTNDNDKWIFTVTLSSLAILMLVFLLYWVIMPLRKISVSLQNENTDDIKHLLKGKTEMNEIARMIADYHQKQDELEASESVKRHIFEQAQVGIIIADKNTGIINTTNPYACNLIDAPEEAIIGNVVENFIKSTNTTHKSGESSEEILLNTDNESIPILCTHTKMMMNGQPVTMNTFVDLSEIKSLRDKLQEEKKKLSLAVENSGMVFCEYNFKTDEIIIDKNWAFITEGASQNKGRNIIDNILESDRKNIINKFEIIDYGKKDAIDVEFRVKHPSRGIIWLSLSILITKRTSEGKPMHMIGLLEDITERVNVQQELIKAKEKAEESDRMKSSYLGNMSHKIRTPLNTIVGFANLLTEEELDADQKDNFINIIRSDTEQVLHLIDDMINLAKIDANQLEVDSKNQHINMIMNNVADYYRASEKTNELKFSVNNMLPDGKDIINTDASQLEQAISNLLNNAFKFTKEGEVELGYFVNPADNKLIIYVKDTGIGIPDNQKDKIFNRFYQVDPMSKGTGLGLTITESIVKMLGGKISFESKENKGTKFFIELEMNQG